MPTSVPDAQDALLTQIAARADLIAAGTLVLLGLPVQVPTEKERVYIDDMTDMDRTQVVEQNLYDQDYILPVLIEVRAVGNSRTERNECRSRAYGILDQVEAAIVDDRELGGAARLTFVENVPRQVTQPLQDGWVTKILMHVRVLSRV